MCPQRLGQHFLKDAGWRARILRALPLSDNSSATPRGERGDTWLEIGAGHGEMTHELARRVGRVIAIELDSKLLPQLEQLAAEHPNVTVVPGDVLALDLARITGGAPFHAYGSLPYYITSPILQRLFEQAERILSINVIVQLEVAVRMTARPGRRDYGYLSVLTQFYTQPEIALRLPPGAFRPPPKVASALVRMTLPGARAQLGIVAETLAPEETERAFLQFVGHCFEQKRKTLTNNLRAHFPAERIAAALATAGIKRQARAEELALPQFAALFHSLKEPHMAKNR